MLVRASAFWVAGLLTLVPYGTYYLLFEASRDQYALLIVLILFWVFGYWGLVGPLLMALKVRAVMNAFGAARSREDVEKMLRSPQTRDVAIDLIATENHIPRFLARRVYGLLVARLASPSGRQDAVQTSSGSRQGP